MKTRVGVAAAILAWTCGSGAGAGMDGTWTTASAGIPRASFGVAHVTIDLATPSTLYAVTNLGTIFKSTDSAGSWQPVRGLTGINYLAVDPRNPMTVYAASNTNGIFKSLDGGATWSVSSRGITNGASIVAVDPVSPSTLYSASYGPGSLLFKSTNGGQSWSPVSGFPSSSTPIAYLAIDPATSSTLFAAVMSGEIDKSTDGGETWTSLTGNAKASFTFEPLAIDPKTPSTLYAGSFAAFQGLATNVPFDSGNGTISKSTDGGKTWTVIRTGIPQNAFVISLVIDPAGSGTIYGTYLSNSGAGILKSLDGGQSWASIYNFPQSDASSMIAISPASPPVVYAGYWNYSPGPGGILRSADGGSSWSAADGGLDYIDLRAMRIDPQHPGVVYTAGGAGVFRSADSGATWSSRGSFQVDSTAGGFVPNPFGPEQGIVRSLLIDPTNPDNLYADIARASSCYYDDLLVLKSVDGGASWSDGISPPDSGCMASGLLGRSGGMMAIDPANPSMLYLQETDDGDGGWTLLRSTDSGATWSNFWTWPSLNTGVNALVIDPSNTAVIYAGLETGFCKTTDSGVNWQCNGLQNSNVTALAMDPGSPGVIYAGTDTGIFQSKDGGASWIATGNGPAGTITSILVAGPSGVVYVATNGNGVYRSTDGGEHWSSLSDGLTSLDVRALAFASGLPDTLYAATASGVFRMAGSNSRVRSAR